MNAITLLYSHKWSDQFVQGDLRFSLHWVNEDSSVLGFGPVLL
jgi:hypothetical protein